MTLVLEPDSTLSHQANIEHGKNRKPVTRSILPAQRATDDPLSTLNTPGETAICHSAWTFRNRPCRGLGACVRPAISEGPVQSQRAAPPVARIDLGTLRGPRWWHRAATGGHLRQAVSGGNLGHNPHVMEERTEAKETREGNAGRSPFERFVARVNGRVSSPPFFFVCAAVVLAWLVSVPLWGDLKSWQAVISTISSVLTLLLLVLLENASRRAEEAAQEKLNVLAEALAALMDSHGQNDSELAAAAGRLRDAVGLEVRH